MLVNTLLPILALLVGSSFARTSHPNARHGRALPHHKIRADHARHVQKVTEAVERREALADLNPVALQRSPRIRKRAASGCRVKGTNSTSSVTSQTTTASSTIITTSATSSATYVAAVANEYTTDADVRF